MELIIAFIILVATIVIGVPVVYSFGLTSIWLVYSLGFDASFVYTTMYSKMNGVVLLAIPLFIILGGVMEKGGVGSALVEMVEAFIGRLKGALCFVASVACAVFGAICGSGAATLSCIGSILAPKMRDRKYPMGIAAAVLACSAPIGMLIPPSSIQILIAWAGNLSVLRCFLATIIPGIILTILIGIVGVVLCKKYPDIVVTEKLPLNQQAARAGKKTLTAIPALVMPLIVLGGIYGGIMTPTEAAAVAAFYGLIVGVFLYREMDFKTVCSSCVTSCETSSIIIVLMAMATLFGNIMTIEDVPGTIARWMLSITESKIIILLLINVLLLIVGVFMEALAAIVILAPILLPVVTGVGVSPLHFGIIMVVNLAIGFLTPPVGVNLFVASGVAQAKIEKISVAVLPMIALMLIVLAIITYCPSVPLMLVH